MGLALMLLIWLITLVSTYFFVAKTWWLPAGRFGGHGTGSMVSSRSPS